MIYFLVLAVIVALCYLFEHAKKKKNARWPYLFIVLLVLLIAVFSAQRGTSGTDNLRFYEPFYQRFIVGGASYTGKEYGYYWFCKLLFKIHPSYKFELFGIATVIWINLLRGAFYFNDNKRKALLFLMVFFFSFYLGPSFNIMRQTLAVSFVFASYKSLIERKPLKYALGILIATFFHTTAIVLLPMYSLIPNEKRKGKGIKNKIINIAIFMSPFIFLYSFDFIINFSIFEKYKLFYGETTSLDIRPTRLLARIPLYIMESYLLLKTKNSKTIKKDFCGKLVILESVSMVIGFYSTWAYRFMYYFSFGHPLFILESLENLNGKKKKLIRIIVGMYFLAYFIIFHVVLKYDEIFPYNP